MDYENYCKDCKYCQFGSYEGAYGKKKIYVCGCKKDLDPFQEDNTLQCDYYEMNEED